MKVTNETLTAEMKAEIENLVKMAEESKVCCMITSHRYAVKNGFVFENAKGYSPIKVTRYITNYGSGIVDVQDVIDGCEMYSKDAIEKARLGFMPVSERDIAKYGKIVKFVVTDKKMNARRIYAAE